MDKVEENTKDLANNNDFVKYFMTSVKQNVNVEEAMTFLIDKIIERLEKHAESGNIIFNDQKKRDTIRIRNSNVNEKQSCC